MAVGIKEPEPYSGDLRIKVRWISNDYDRIHQLFIMKVDARGQVVYNLTIPSVDKNGGKTYCWEAVDPESYRSQLVPLLELERGVIHQMYQSLLEHLIHTGFIAPPSTTAAEDVERKMLVSENEFLKELVTTLAGTRKEESWHTTLTRDHPTEELQQRYVQIKNELIRRRIGHQTGPWPHLGTTTTFGANGTIGHSQQESVGAFGEPSSPSATPTQKDIPNGGLVNDREMWATLLDHSASWQWDSKDRG